MNSRRGSWDRAIGPAFAIIALLSPGVIAAFEPAWLRDTPAAVGMAAVQPALLTIGLSIAVVSAALATYHIPAPRRILHAGLLFTLLELFYRLAYGGSVSPGLLLSVGETSQRETLELLAGHLFLTGFLALFAVLAVYSLIRSWASDIHFSQRRCLLLGAMAAALIMASVALSTRSGADNRGNAHHLYSELRATFPFDVVGSLGSVAIELINSRREAPVRAAFEFSNVRMLSAGARQDESEIYVVVIGETSRRANWSLFGYSRPTTPGLGAIRNSLILFPHMTSNATTTILSLPLALTRAAAANRGVARSEKSIVSLLRQAGFETYWISNQERSGAMSNSISQIALEADHVSFPENIPADALRGGFDSNLLTRLDDALHHIRKGGKAVLFLHMEGSHYDYADRYPAEFQHFGAAPGERRIGSSRRLRLIDEYDNSVLYTDHNLRGVVDRLSGCVCKSGLIFFSDHGERLLDNGMDDREFGHGFPSVSRQEIEIPFFLWLSDSYRQANAMRVSRLIDNSNSFAQLDNLFETVVDLAGVDYDGRNSSLSLFSERLEQVNTLEVLNIDEEVLSLPLQADEHGPRIVGGSAVGVQPVGGPRFAKYFATR